MRNDVTAKNEYVVGSFAHGYHRNYLAVVLMVHGTCFFQRGVSCLWNDMHSETKLLCWLGNFMDGPQIASDREIGHGVS